MYALSAVVKKRYELRYQNRAQLDQESQITVTIDEWREITKAAPDTADYIKTLLTSGRKVRMSIIIGSHSDRAEPLGLKGEADLKDGFTVVRLKGDKQRGYNATIDKGNGEIPVSLPGPYQPALPSPAKPLELQSPPMPEDDRRVLEMFDAGKSITAIGADVFGNGVHGGEQNKMVKEILQKYKRV